MKVRITAPSGKKIKHVPTRNVYSEVICDETKVHEYVVADGDEELSVELKDGTTLSDRVADLEDAVIELAEIIAGGE